MRKRVMRLATITLVALLAGCGSGGRAPDQTTFTFDFAHGAQGWTTGFSDYPVGQEQFFQLDSGLRALPPPLDQSGTGILLSGINHSDDLFMFLTGHLTRLKPDQTYSFKFRVEFATNAPAGVLVSAVFRVRGCGSRLALARSNPIPRPWQALTV
jgi:hypothetical protein